MKICMKEFKFMNLGFYFSEYRLLFYFNKKKEWIVIVKKLKKNKKIKLYTFKSNNFNSIVLSIKNNCLEEENILLRKKDKFKVKFIKNLIISN